MSGEDTHTSLLENHLKSVILTNILQTIQINTLHHHQVGDDRKTVQQQS